MSISVCFGVSNIEFLALTVPLIKFINLEKPWTYLKNGKQVIPTLYISKVDCQVKCYLIHEIWYHWFSKSGPQPIGVLETLSGSTWGQNYSYYNIKKLFAFIIIILSHMYSGIFQWVALWYVILQQVEYRSKYKNPPVLSQTLQTFTKIENNAHFSLIGFSFGK